MRKTEVKSDAIHFIVSLSPTMNVLDVDFENGGVSRLDVVKKNIIQFVDNEQVRTNDLGSGKDQYEGKYISLVVYGDEKKVLFPTTQDYSTATRIISNIHTNLVPGVANGLNDSLQFVQENAQTNDTIVLFTDSEGIDSFMGELRSDLTFIVVGIGSDQGGTVVSPVGQLVKKNGDIWNHSYEEKKIRNLGRRFRYLRVDSHENDIQDSLFSGLDTGNTKMLLIYSIVVYCLFLLFI